MRRGRNSSRPPVLRMNAGYRKIENAGPAGLLSQRFYTPGALTVTDKDQVSSVTLCSVTSVRSAGSYGGVQGVPKWGQNRRGDITSTVIIPESLLPQENNRDHTRYRKFTDYIIVKFRFFCIFHVDSIAFHHRLLLNFIGFKLSSASPNCPSLSRYELFTVRKRFPPGFIISIRVRSFSAVG